MAKVSNHSDNQVIVVILKSGASKRTHPKTTKDLNPVLNII